LPIGASAQHSILPHSRRRSTSFLQQTLQQIGYSQPRRPSVQIGQVQPGSTDSYDPAQVVPLPLRHLAAGAIPAELVQNRVLSGSNCTFNRIAERFRFRDLPASELSLAELVLLKRKNIEFEGTGVVDEIEGAPPYMELARDPTSW
jgi:hypothetical protein